MHMTIWRMLPVRRGLRERDPISMPAGRTAHQVHSHVWNLEVGGSRTYTLSSLLTYSTTRYISAGHRVAQYATSVPDIAYHARRTVPGALLPTAHPQTCALIRPGRIICHVSTGHRTAKA
eukprot:1221163-Rhodomonas_salina.3